MLIYKITNTINGKIYIGQTKRGMKRRWKGHINSAKHNKSNNLFHNAIQKYGESSFQIEIIDHANSLEELDKLEKTYIDRFNSLHPNGYNTKTGGNSPRYSKLSRKKMSEAKLNSSLSNETRQKMSDSHKARWNKDLRKEQSKRSKQYWQDKQYRKKISEARKEYWSDPKNRKYASQRGLQTVDKKKISEAVSQAFQREEVKERFNKFIVEKQQKAIVDSNGTIYSSLKEAAKQLGVNSSNICKVLKGKYKTCRGLTFQYVANKPILYLVIGVSGSGKSWICNQLKDKFHYVSYDENKKSDITSLLLSGGDKKILYDPVIGISTFIKRNSDKFDIKVVAIIDDFITIKHRLINRGGRVTKSLYNRYKVIKQRSDKYAHFSGTSLEVLNYLKDVIK